MYLAKTCLDQEEAAILDGNADALAGSLGYIADGFSIASILKLPPAAKASQVEKKPSERSQPVTLSPLSSISEMGTCPHLFAQPISFGTLIARYSHRQSILKQPSGVGLQISGNPSPMYHMLQKILFCTRKNSTTATTFNITKRTFQPPTNRLHQDTANGESNVIDTRSTAILNKFRNEEVLPNCKCRQCGKTYKCKSSLRSHKQSHSLPWKCHFCGKAFASKWSFQGHERTHTGEKPFVCPTYQRSSADPLNLQSHKQTHLVVKRYRCPHSHMQVHRVVRSWRCPHCIASFSRRGLLSRHLEKCPFPALATAAGTRDVSIIYPVSTA
eukprot:TsM_000352200 transcript=TsM_000352200 gene=TsM_000352200